MATTFSTFDPDVDCELEVADGAAVTSEGDVAAALVEVGLLALVVKLADTIGTVMSDSKLAVLLAVISDGRPISGRSSS